MEGLQARLWTAIGSQADGKVPLTAFLPNDRAFDDLVTALTSSRPAPEEATFNAVAGLGIDTVEKILEYHVVPGQAIASGAALKANGATLETALPGKLTSVKVNKGSAQIAHGINAVLLPTA